MSEPLPIYHAHQPAPDNAELHPGQLVDVELRRSPRADYLICGPHGRAEHPRPPLQYRKLIKDHLGHLAWTEWKDV